MAIDLHLVHQYTKNLSLLYVEDDEALRPCSADLFQKFFGTLLVASNGQEAIELYTRYQEEHKQCVDIVITDILMPIMNGMELISHIRKICPDQIIIILSAYNDSDRLLSLIELGIDSFLVKPIEYEPLLELLYKYAQRIEDRKVARQYHERLEEMNRKLKEAYTIIAEQKKELEAQLRGVHEKK